MTRKRITRKQAESDNQKREEIEQFNPFSSRDRLERSPSVLESSRANISNTANNESEDIELNSTIRELGLGSSVINSTLRPIAESSPHSGGSGDTLSGKSKKNNRPIAVARSSISVAMAQAVPLKDALKVVREFNGENIPLSVFLEGCDEAREMVTAADLTNLTKLIRSKLTGEARTAIHGHTFVTLDALKDFVKSIYAPAKTVHQLQGEMGNEFQRDDESVVAFANRIRELARRILEAKRVTDGADVTDVFRDTVTADTIECFKNGLKPDIERRLSTRPSAEIADIVKDAIKAERVLEAQAALRNPYKEREHRYNASKRRTYACQVCNLEGHETAHCLSKGESNVTCSYCGKVGHSSDKCFQRTRDQNKIISCQICNQNDHTAVQCGILNNNKCQICNGLGHKLQACPKQTQMTCQVCGKYGHSADKCYQVVNKAQNICQICQRSGHTANNCFQLKQMQNSAAKNCQICSRSGHTANECFQLKLNQNATNCQLCNRAGHSAATCRVRPNEVKICNYCKNRGHTINECRKRMINENWRSGNSQGAPRMSAELDAPKEALRSMNTVPIDDLLSELLPLGPQKQ